MGGLNYIVLAWVIYQLSAPTWVKVIFCIAAAVDWLLAFLERMAKK